MFYNYFHLYRIH